MRAAGGGLGCGDTEVWFRGVSRRARSSLDAPAEPPSDGDAAGDDADDAAGSVSMLSDEAEDDSFLGDDASDGEGPASAPPAPPPTHAADASLPLHLLAGAAVEVRSAAMGRRSWLPGTVVAAAASSGDAGAADVVHVRFWPFSPFAAPLQLVAADVRPQPPANAVALQPHLVTAGMLVEVLVSAGGWHRAVVLTPQLERPAGTRVDGARLRAAAAALVPVGGHHAMLRALASEELVEASEALAAQRSGAAAPAAPQLKQARVLIRGHDRAQSMTLQQECCVLEPVAAGAAGASSMQPVRHAQGWLPAEGRWSMVANDTRLLMVSLQLLREPRDLALCNDVIKPLLRARGGDAGAAAAAQALARRVARAPFDNWQRCHAALAAGSSAAQRRQPSLHAMATAAAAAATAAAAAAAATAASAAEPRVPLSADEGDGGDGLLVAARLQALLKPHQCAGVRFMWANLVTTWRTAEAARAAAASGASGSAEEPEALQQPGCVLAHFMGLGKSLQTLTFLHTLHRAEPGLRVLLMMPTNVLANWEAEFSKWLPVGSPGLNRSHVHIVGLAKPETLAQRLATIELWAASTHGAVLLISTSMFEKRVTAGFARSKPRKRKSAAAAVDLDAVDAGPAAAAPEPDAVRMATLLCESADVCVVDEAHELRNRNGLRAIALRKIKTARRLALTGYVRACVSLLWVYR
jgi:hypothetical protein